MDMTLDGTDSPAEVLRYIHIGLLCIQDQARDRPTMLEVVIFLSNETSYLPPPKEPGFYIVGDMGEIEQHNSYSIIEATNSLISGCV
ncbi:hypothetical protein Fmac_014474 [Flemingia macrophylla]|uniref:S-locus receptor kinase C-terminal domain-containing protein n=1 Tax=Flemingia macrophylla TaxID=520843 RepID=A0ABD1MBU6_9FABA